jgi:hypothetical protein
MPDRRDGTHSAPVMRLATRRGSKPPRSPRNRSRESPWPRAGRDRSRPTASRSARTGSRQNALERAARIPLEHEPASLDSLRAAHGRLGSDTPRHVVLESRRSLDRNDKSERRFRAVRRPELALAGVLVPVVFTLGWLAAGLFRRNANVSRGTQPRADPVEGVGREHAPADTADLLRRHELRLLEQPDVLLHPGQRHAEGPGKLADRRAAGTRTQTQNLTRPGEDAPAHRGPNKPTSAPESDTDPGT